ncbi:MAG: tRNA lysidine(34) synthetase TilS [Nitrospirae bacterium]|nr:tRNA lysidine(34) synthetase TilS [Nitrospirota bacterium]
MKETDRDIMTADDLLEKAEQTIRKNGLIAEGDSVLVGFSGGPDSTCLLYVLHALKEKYQLQIYALYIDHNLRPVEVPGEIEFCRKFCEGLGVPFMVESIDVISYSKEHRMNRQEAARELRYRAFGKTAAEIRADKVALAHNGDDQAETLLMRLVRGAGPTGLSGIPARRDNIIRPLLEIGRDEIERFLERRNIVPVTDSSNLKEDYFRNMIRLRLMPMLKQANPNLLQPLTHTMAIMREEERYFGILVTKTLMKLISRKSEKRIELFLSPMEAMEVVILRRVLRRAICETEGLRGIGFLHIEDIIALIRNGKNGDRLVLPRNIRVIKEYALLVITSEEPVRIAEYALDLPGKAVIVNARQVVTAEREGGDVQFGDGRSSVLLDAEKVSFPLTVRPRRTGDYFYPVGFGRKKKLQDFFVDLKIARDERDSIPIIVSGDDIVWVAGYRADDRFKVTETTKKFVRLGIVKGKF